MRIHMFFGLLTLLLVSLVTISIAGTMSPVDRGVQLKVIVRDAKEDLPVELARVVLRRNSRMIAQDATNPAGQIRFRDIQPGKYDITAWFVGYETYSDSIVIDQDHTTYSIALKPRAQNQQGLEILGHQEIALSHIDLRTGNQVFESQTYHAPPTARMTNLIQENMMGAARAPTGEVHIRGQHGEFTYYVDGIPVPLGVFGGLNEVVDRRAQQPG